MPLSLQIDDSPSQKITLAGLTFFIKWCSYQSSWSVSVYQEDVLLIAGIKLVLNIFLLVSYDLGIGDLAVFNVNNRSLDPQRNGLGTEWVVVYYTQDEINAIS